MKIMPCPLNGPRNIQEFICAGPVEPHPDPNRCSDHEWTEFVWMEENLAGVVREWWCHVATSYWFIAERNTVSDEILATYPADRIFSERVEFEPLAPPPEPAAAPASKPAPAETTPEPPKEAAPPPEPPPAETAPAEAAPEPSEAAPTEAAQDAPMEELAASEPEPEPEPAPDTPETPEEAVPAAAAAEGDAPADEASADAESADDAPADEAPAREPKDPAP